MSAEILKQAPGVAIVEGNVTQIIKKTKEIKKSITILRKARKEK